MSPGYIYEHGAKEYNEGCRSAATLTIPPFPRSPTKLGKMVGLTRAGREEGACVFSKLRRARCVEDRRANEMTLAAAGGDLLLQHVVPGRVLQGRV
jgi:hypothetical protein